MNEIRAFLALQLPGDIQGQLSQIQQMLRHQLPPVSWVRPGNIHVTLKFFGNILPALVDSLYEALGDIGSQTIPFWLNVQGIGVFPHLRAPRVIWAGLTGPVHKVIQLHDQIQILLEPLGFPLEEKPFHPHVTLARIKSDGKNVGKVLNERGCLDVENVVGEWLVDSMVLYRSELSSSGARYEALWRVPFKGRPES